MKKTWHQTEKLRGIIFGSLNLLPTGMTHCWTAEFLKQEDLAMVVLATYYADANPIWTLQKPDEFLQPDAWWK